MSHRKCRSGSLSWLKGTDLIEADRNLIAFVIDQGDVHIVAGQEIAHEIAGPAIRQHLVELTGVHPGRSHRERAANHVEVPDVVALGRFERIERDDRVVLLKRPSPVTLNSFLLRP